MEWSIVHISCPICANDLGPYIEWFKVYLNHWCELSGKCALTSLHCISVTDDVKINEQNTSIATGFIYVQTDFEAVWKLLSKDILRSWPPWGIGPCDNGKEIVQDSKINYTIDKWCGMKWWIYEVNSFNRLEVIVIQAQSIFIPFYLYTRRVIFSWTVPNIY